MNYIIVDRLRLADLQRMDLTAENQVQAQHFAAEMAQQYGCRVYVLGVVGVVECPATVPQWVRPIGAK